MNPTSTKILITNVHSIRNAGDRVLLEVTLEQLRQNFPNSQVILALNDLSLLPGADLTTLFNHSTIVHSFFAWFKQDVMESHTQPSSSLYLVTIQLLFACCYAILFRIAGIRASLGLSEVQRKTVDAYIDADLVISCPGNFLYSRAHAWGTALLSPVFSIAFAWLVGKPLYMMPQTIGPLWRRWERWLVRWLVQRFRVIQVRDQYSKDLLKAIGVLSAKIHVVPDLAFAFRSSDLQEAQMVFQRYRIPSDKSQPLLGITLINWGSQHPRFTGQAQYESAIARTICQFLHENEGYVVILSQVTGPRTVDDDRIPAFRLQQLLATGSCAERVIVVGEALAPSVLRTLYGMMDLLVGSRLHSNIFALSAGTPVVAIAYQAKTHGVMKSVDLGQWVIDIDKVTEMALSNLISLAWDQRLLLKDHIQNVIPNLAKECQFAMQRILIDFQNT